MARNPDPGRSPVISVEGDEDSGGGGGCGPSYHSSGAEKWWRIHPFRGMARDVHRRAPYYGSDWRDAWDYRVVPATVYMYFAKYESRSAFFAIVGCLRIL